MGLRCSILGHTFDETEVRRDRRERGSGNEVVTVVSQVERCSRCGTERVVSENKEVVSVVDAAEVGLDEEGEGDATTGEVPPADRVSHDARESGTDTGAALAGDASEETDADAGIDDEPGQRAREEAESGVADGTDDTDGTDPSGDPDPAEEDVEFITETEGALGGGEDVAEDVPSDAGESAGGIGGMAARSGAFDGSDDPDAESGGTGAGDESVGDDAEILDAPETERAPGQWPDEPDEDEPWEPDALDEDEEEGPGSTADPAPDVEPVAESSFTVPEGSLRCPDCGHEVSADSSFRAGDACPECQGYLEDAE